MTSMTIVRSPAIGYAGCSRPHGAPDAPGDCPMRTITLQVPDELADQLAAVQDRLPELLALSLRQPALPAQLYRTILTFLAGAPSAEEIAAFAPPPEAQQRLQVLLDAERAGTLRAIERAELDELERIEHLVILVKSGALPTLAPAS